jgi:hypothetical protein
MYYINTLRRWLRVYLIFVHGITYTNMPRHYLFQPFAPRIEILRVLYYESNFQLRAVYTART